ncbi:MAG: CDP-glycerol glycerophosphotransferase family protein [Spirochaetes bacterium]|nr:CDP-glycerol glycerophosphotransferase family protein [Spirochaetota bacterium]
MIFFPLYIDPGTGSALFSIAIGIAAVAYFFVRGLIIKLKVLVFRKVEQESRNKYVIYAEDKRYWLFFEHILNELEGRQIETLYLTSSADDPVFSAGYNFVKAKYIGQGNKALAYLNFLSAEFVLTTTPELDVLQWKRSKNVKHYCHYVHAAGGPSLYRLFSLDYFDSVLLSSELDVPEIRHLENVRKLPEKQLAVVGNSYFDRCAERLKNIPGKDVRDFTVLVSPSWGPSALLKMYGERLLDPLVETGWRIIIRPHPQSAISEKPMLESLAGRYEGRSNVEWDYSHENIYSLSRADIMISDFSGIVYDYVFLFDRPVLVNVQKLDFRRLDAHNLDEKPYYYQAFSKVGLELEESALGSIKDVISGMMHNAEFDKNRREVKTAMWRHQGAAGKRVVDFMLETAGGINTAGKEAG